MQAEATKRQKDDSNTTTHPTACILCSRNCGITVSIDNDKITKIKGDPEHPMTEGYICQKAARLEHYQNNDDRLDSPLKKMPDGSFAKVSWDQAISEIAAQMISLRDEHGPDCYASLGGGGQGNHLGGAYGAQLRRAMGGSRYFYSALGQEKTMDFWMNGRLFGDQRVHCTEDIEHSDYVLFIGCNPYQAHGIPNARNTLREIKKDPNRKMVVFDPRRTETAKDADIHFQLKPGTDAYLMLAILAIIVTEDLHDKAFLSERTKGFEGFEELVRAVPIDDYIAIADVDKETVYDVARGFAAAKAGCVRIDLGLQQSLHSTLTAYLEKMLYIVTGNFGKKGANNIHTSFMPFLANTDERKREYKRTKHHKMLPIAGILPPNILPDEIETEGGIKAIFVDSCNPVVTYADSAAYERAFEKLDLLVVIDVAMTETAKLASYVLPASSQFEKWEATGFNLEFPKNFFHLRKPMFKPLPGTLTEPEIYTRILEKMGVMPESFPILERVAKYEPSVTAFQAYFAALMALFKKDKGLAAYAPSIMYRTLGKVMEDGPEGAVVFLPLAVDYARKYEKAVRRAGIEGNKFTLGANLFKKIASSPSGTLISKHEFEDTWSLIKTQDKKIHLEVPEVFEEIKALSGPEELDKEFPFILFAGERRAYNANQIYRNPEWRKTDKEGALRIHPNDAEKLSVENGDMMLCRSRAGEIEVSVDVDDTIREGVVTLPHGYGMTYKGKRNGPAINWLTSGDHCEPFTKTPYHKYVPVSLEKVVA